MAIIRFKRIFLRSERIQSKTRKFMKDKILAVGTSSYDIRNLSLLLLFIRNKLWVYILRNDDL